MAATSNSKVVFVGNVPYNFTEDQLKDVFRTVGQVVGFRLVYDKGKPRGYGFCEFADHETAASAVRNLNGVEVGGRDLRIDLADSDPYLEGKTTQHGVLVDAGESRSQWRDRERSGAGSEDFQEDRKREPTNFLASLPPGVPLPPNTNALDATSHILGTMNPQQLTEVLAQMKAFVINHPEQARILLVAHPQFAYALFQALVLQNIVDPAILQRMLSATKQPSGAVVPPAVAPSQVPPHVPTPPNQPGMPPQVHPPYPPYGHQPPMHAMQQPQAGFYRPPPPQAPPIGMMPPQHAPTPPQAAPAAPAPPAQTATPQPAIDPLQREMLMQVLRLSPEQIANLPPNEREAIQQLKTQYLSILNPGG